MSMTEFTGQTYGEGARQRASQRMVPTGPSPTAGMPPGGGGGGEISLPPFDRPTEFPDEPVTAGIDQPSPIGIDVGSRMDLALQLRAISSRYPNPALLALLQELER
jgi:hypothetical protein